MDAINIIGLIFNIISLTLMVLVVFFFIKLTDIQTLKNNILFSKIIIGCEAIVFISYFITGNMFGSFVGLSCAILWYFNYKKYKDELELRS